MDPKAPRPPLSPEELIALRDGELPSSEIGDALVGDFAAQRQLLESRLLSLALSLASGAKQARASQGSLLGDAGVERTAVDTDRLVRYISGEMEQAEALAFERTLRGDPRAFAKLIEVKDAFFGEARALSKAEPPPMPRIERQLIGMLFVDVDSRKTLLRLERSTEDNEPRIAASFSLESPRNFELERKEDELEDLLERAERLQRDIRSVMSQLQDISTQLRSRRDPKLAMFRTRLFSQLSLMSGEFMMIIERLELAAELRPTARKAPMVSAARRIMPLTPSFASVQAGGANLRFMAGNHRLGEVLLTIRPTSSTASSTTFTWVVPGIDFKDLEPGDRAHRLGRVRDGSLLLIDQGYGPTQVLKVAVREVDEDFF